MGPGPHLHPCSTQPGRWTGGACCSPGPSPREAGKPATASAHAARQQLSPEKVVAPCQVPVASPQRHNNNYDPSRSFWRAPLFLEHVALHRHRLRDCHHAPVRGESAAELASCPVGTWPRGLEDEDGWGGWRRQVLIPQVGTSPEGAGDSPTAAESEGAHSDVFLVWAQLRTSAGLGRVPLILARAHAYICSPEI